MAAPAPTTTEGKPRRKQSTRMLKCQCGFCGYVVRTTRTWLDEYGPPLCPCNSKQMEGPDDGEAYAAEYLKPAYKMIRETWVDSLRSIQTCYSCNRELAHGETARYRVYSVDGEFLTQYQCMQCTSNNDRGRAARVLARY